MLGDLLVLDLSAYLPGPYATQLLADLGARVVKVEAPSGAPPRHVPPHDARGTSSAFRALNAGKESVALDLKAAAGRELLLRLVPLADVLIEGFRPGVMERLGVGPEPCLARNPRLIYARLTGFGQTGPYRERAGHDLTYQAYSGALGLGAGPDGHPATPGLQSGDLLGAYAAATGILAALHARPPDGGGRVLDVSILDALISAQGLHLLGHREGLRAEARSLPLNGAAPCYDVYRAACGGHLALAALEPKFWEAFCEIVERPEWSGRGFDPGLRTELAALFLTRSRDEWRVILENSECCCAPVLRYDELWEDDHLRARGILGPERIGPPLRAEPPLPEAPREVPLAPGAQRAALLRELLGIESAEERSLAERGAFG